MHTGTLTVYYGTKVKFFYFKRHSDVMLAPQKFGLSFARAVTVESDDALDCVARKGENSLFQVIQDLMPEVCFDKRKYESA